MYRCVQYPLKTRQIQNTSTKILFHLLYKGKQVNIMTFWKKIMHWKTLGKTPCVPSIQHSAHHELIERSEEELATYEKWKLSRCKDELLSYISQNFKVWKKTPCEQCDAIDFLTTKSFRGFVVHFMDLDKECNEVVCLFDYLKEKTLSLGYQSYLSDIRYFRKKRWKERIERHYLKPSIQFDEKGRQIQRFGNISIELLFRDEEPFHLKFSACFCKDNRFSIPEKFEDLIEFITNK